MLALAERLEDPHNIQPSAAALNAQIRWRPFMVGVREEERVRLGALDGRRDRARVKDALRANTDELIQRGGYGSLTVYVGNDHLPLVQAALLRLRGRGRSIRSPASWW